VLRPGFEPGSPARKNDNISSLMFSNLPCLSKSLRQYICNTSIFAIFRRWLQARGFSYKYVIDCVGYARRYADFLFGWRPLSEIETVRGKRHVLMALSNFAKFLGIYEEWKRMLRRYDVHWSDGNNSVDVFSILLNGKESVKEADNYLKEVKRKVDLETWRIVHFLALSGVRPTEALNCFNLVAKGELSKGYLDEELLILQHWRYPDIFIRGGKKLFITVLTERMLRDLREWESKARGVWYYEKLKRRLHKAGVRVNLYILRKAWATKMRTAGLEPELVDLCQGRMPPTTFVRSYFRPDLRRVIERVREILEAEERKYI